MQKLSREVNIWSQHLQYYGVLSAREYYKRREEWGEMSWKECACHLDRSLGNAVGIPLRIPPPLFRLTNLYCERSSCQSTQGGPEPSARST